MKNSYNDLETKICNFSLEIPKLEGQIEILEAIATAIENKELGLGWDPKAHCPLPNVDVYLNQPCARNLTKCKCPKFPS